MFDLSKEDKTKLAAWAKEQDEKVMELQKDSDLEHFGMPYYGAIAGQLTYSFTPTSLGLITTVRNNLTKEEIDLTDYDAW